MTYPRTEFDYLWSMALSGYLKHAHIIFTRPHYNSALVTHLSVSNEPIEWTPVRLAKARESGLVGYICLNVVFCLM